MPTSAATRALGSLPLVIAAFGCALEGPAYDDELGLQAVPVAPGSLAGDFVLKASVTSIAELPVSLGDDGDLTGGESYYLLTRSWDEDEQRYLETRTLCGGLIYDTAGTSSTITDERWRLVPDIETTTIEVAHERGTYVALDHAEQWAIDLDDPVHGDMPDDGDEARTGAWAGRVFDIDEDDKPGMTMTLEGLGQGEVYFCQRKKIALDGYVVDESGETIGLVTADFDQVTLDASSPLLMNQLDRRPHPDPREAWFHIARLREAASCESVLSAVEQELVSRRNPFF